jgi:hypothetical protein
VRRSPKLATASPVASPENPKIPSATYSSGPVPGLEPSAPESRSTANDQYTALTTPKESATPKSGADAAHQNHPRPGQPGVFVFSVFAGPWGRSAAFSAATVKEPAAKAD